MMQPSAQQAAPMTYGYPPQPSLAQGEPGIMHVSVTYEIPNAPPGQIDDEYKIDLKGLGRKAADAAEREAIIIMLRHTGGNKREAADRLGISYKAILYKIREFGIGRPRNRRPTLADGDVAAARAGTRVAADPELAEIDGTRTSSPLSMSDDRARRMSRMSKAKMKAKRKPMKKSAIAGHAARKLRKTHGDSQELMAMAYGDAVRDILGDDGRFCLVDGERRTRSGSATASVGSACRSASARTTTPKSRAPTTTPTRISQSHRSFC